LNSSDPALTLMLRTGFRQNMSKERALKILQVTYRYAFTFIIHPGLRQG
jgi:hypothetical protein